MLSVFESLAITVTTTIVFILLVLLQAFGYFCFFYAITWLTFWTFGPEIFGYTMSTTIPLATVFAIYIIKFVKKAIG